MKKISVFTIIFILIAVFVSCNADQDIGLLAQVAASQPQADIKIIRFLGINGDDKYILAHDGIYKNGTRLFANTNEDYISSASLTSETDVFKVLLTDGHKGQVLKDGDSFKLVKDGATAKYLSLKGKYFADEYSIYLESEDSVLLVAPLKGGVYKCNLEGKSYSFDSRPVAFQKIDSGFIVMTQDRSFYYSTGDETTGKIGESSAFSSYKVTQIASFADGDKAYFKGSSTFVEVTKNSINTTSAVSALETTDIANIVKTDDGWIAATVKSGLYKIGKDLKAERISL